MIKTEALYYDLLKQWCDALVELQLSDVNPIISGHKDIVTLISGHMALLQKARGRLQITTDGTIVNMDAEHRIFNPVGGFLAFPLRIKLSAGQKCRVYLKYENR